MRKAHTIKREDVQNLYNMVRFLPHNMHPFQLQQTTPNYRP